MAGEGPAYAPREYAAACEAVGRLDAELRAQTDRFALARSYDRITQLAAELEAAADTADPVVEAEKSASRRKLAGSSPMPKPRLTTRDRPSMNSLTKTPMDCVQTSRMWVFTCRRGI